MTRLVATLGVVLMVWSGCRKPEVEIEEESPPLPEPEPGPDASGDVPRAAEEKLPLELSVACKLVDKELREAGVATYGRTCDTLRLQGSMLRLNVYIVPTKPPRNFNACFWKRSDGPGYAVGYFDRVDRPCVDQDTYCRQGAKGALVDVSAAACPGERDHLLPGGDLAAGLARLVGDWVGAGVTVSIKADGTTTITRGGDSSAGVLRVVATTRLELANPDKGTGTPLAYARDADHLWLSRGLIVPAEDPEAFVIPISEHLRIRRYAGECWAASDKPPAAPVKVPCSITRAKDDSRLEVAVPDGPTLHLYRRGAFWMDAEGLGTELRRAR